MKNTKENNLIWEAYQDVNKDKASSIVEGILIETEHTNPEIAKQLKAIPKDALVLVVNIALDHLDEDPHYYKKLSKANL